MAETLINTCPACGAEESLDALINRMIESDALRHLLQKVFTETLPVGGLLIRYLRLHKPPKHRLSVDKMARVLEELVPDLTRSVVERDGRTYAVSNAQWIAAFNAVFEAEAKGALVPPLRNNSYLYAVLLRKVDQGEAQAEQAHEAARRTGGGRSPATVHTVTVRGEALPIGQALEGMFGGRDPALVKLDQDALRATGMPEGVRKFRESLGRPPAKDTP